MSISKVIADWLFKFRYRAGYRKASRLQQSDISRMKETRDVQGLINACRYLRYSFSASSQGLVYKAAVKALGDTGDLRAVGILAEGLNSHCIWQDEAARSLIKLKAVDAAVDALAQYDGEARKNAVTILGNLEDDRSMEALIAFLNGPAEDEMLRAAACRHLKKYQSSTKLNGALLEKIKQTLLKVEDGREALKKQAEEERVAELQETQSVSGLSDAEIIDCLANLCDAYARNDPSSKKLEPQAEKIGKLLNRRGGLPEMRRIFDCLGGMPGSRTLEMHWSGIGDWRG